MGYCIAKFHSNETDCLSCLLRHEFPLAKAQELIRKQEKRGSIFAAINSERAIILLRIEGEWRSFLVNGFNSQFETAAEAEAMKSDLDNYAKDEGIDANFVVVNMVSVQ